jgi:hypothetical protein
MAVAEASRWPPRPYSQPRSDPGIPTHMPGSCVTQRAALVSPSAWPPPEALGRQTAPVAFCESWRAILDSCAAWPPGAM